MVTPTHFPSSRTMAKNCRITISDIAKEAGVSKATVSMALRGMSEISEGTRERINQIAQDMGYRADPSLAKIAASRWKNRKAREGSLLALIEFSEESGEVEPNPIARGFCEKAEQLGYLIELHRVSTEKELSRLTRILYHRGVEGVALVAAGQVELKEYYPWDDFSTVTIGDFGDSVPVDRFNKDSCTEMSTTLRKLISKGYSRVGLILSGTDASAASDFARRGLFEGLLKANYGADSRTPVLIGDNLTSAEIREWAEAEQLEVVIGYDDSVFEKIRACGLSSRLGFVSLCTDGAAGRIAGFADSGRRIGTLGVECLDKMILLGAKGRLSETTSYQVCSHWVDGKSLGCATIAPMLVSA